MIITSKTKVVAVPVLSRVYGGPFVSLPGGTPLDAPTCAFRDPTVVFLGLYVRIAPINNGGLQASATQLAGTLPTGLSFDADGSVTGLPGTIYGTPTVLETKTGIQVRLTNATGSADSAAFSIRVDPAPSEGTGSHFGAAHGHKAHARSSGWR